LLYSIQKIPLLIVGGATASGKSALALQLAHELNGEIINADSMQVYEPLKILTARPTENPEGIAHHLYGLLSKNENGSVSWWLENACPIIQDIHSRGKLPIVTGGTGLYLRALTHGLSYIPPIPDDIRLQVKQYAEKLEPEAFYNLVCQHDPLIENRLRDSQRLIRALEVILATNQSIRKWQENTQPSLPISPLYLVVSVEREILYQRINQRLEFMVEQGALEEVANLHKTPFEETSGYYPILTAIGVKEFTQHQSGTLSLEEAIVTAQQASRNYAKRQMTWFRNQVQNPIVIDEFSTELLKTIRKSLSITS
jgi:tRNA dimethylallyltransferase